MEEIYELTIIQKALEQICNEMTITLKKTAFSPNIKERMDFSCALFTESGDLMASKEGIPVHLGSMEDAVKYVINKFKLAHREINKGDIIVHNNPNEGGTHLPDINLIMPIFSASPNFSGPIFYASCRAHHADVGGKAPGSMPSFSESLFEEGIQIPGIKLWSKGELNLDLMDLLLINVRTPKERKGDFFAQRSALIVGEKRLLSLMKKYSLEKLLNYIEILIENSRKAMESFLDRIPNVTVDAQDYLDSDGSSNEKVKLVVTVSRLEHKKILLDFTGSSEQRYANCNATSAITKSCSYFVFRYLLAFQGDFATNAGLWKPLVFNLPEKTIVNSTYPFATSSGNVETSQRIVDLLFGALAKITELQAYIPAASQGTMNNITIGGIYKNSFFSYYETIAGGSGATFRDNGTSGVHTNMTNTLNTPIEALELSYPLRITQYRIRENSGGKGLYSGGDGLVREYEILCERAQINMQSERRILTPYGLYGGSNGLKGENILITKNRDEILLEGRFNRILCKGEKVRILTPGGGGYKHIMDELE